MRQCYVIRNNEASGSGGPEPATYSVPDPRPRAKSRSPVRPAPVSGSRSRCSSASVAIKSLSERRRSNATAASAAERSRAPGVVRRSGAHGRPVELSSRSQPGKTARTAVTKGQSGRSLGRRRIQPPQSRRRRPASRPVAGGKLLVRVRADFDDLESTWRVAVPILASVALEA